MRRRLVNLVTALSLLLCTAAVELWVRSYSAKDALTWPTGKGFYKLQSN